MAFLITETGKVINSDKIVVLDSDIRDYIIIAKLEDSSRVNLVTIANSEDGQRLLKWIAVLSCFDKAVKLRHLAHILKYSESFTSTIERLDALEVNEALIDLINSEAVIKIPREFNDTNISGEFQKT